MDAPGVTVVALSGELDITERDDIERAVTEAVARPGTRQVVVDLDAVTFIDSEALGAVLTGYTAATAAGLEFRLVNPHGVVRRVLDVAGLTELFRIA